MKTLSLKKKGVNDKVGDGVKIEDDGLGFDDCSIDLRAD